MERRVHVSEKGMKLDRFLRIHFPQAGNAARLLKSGRLTVDGRPFRLADALAAGQVVRIAEAPRGAGQGRDPASSGGEGEATAPKRPPADPAVVARLAAMTLFSDDEIIAFDKPSGLAVHAGTRTEEDLDSLLATLADAEGERPVLVHRLDKDTSGLLVAARTRAAAARWSKIFAGRRIEKTYLAVVEGVPEPRSGRIARPLKKTATPRGGRMVEAAADDPDGLACETYYEVLEVRDHGRASLLALRPKTGRQHQLRAHAALLGHPILGDRLYGRAGTARRLMLHALRLAFVDGDGRERVLEAPIPAEFAVGDGARGAERA